MTDINPLLRDRWSPRGFDTAHEVTDDDVRLLLEAARWAPSGLNRQPWRFIVGRRGDATRARIDTFVAGHSDWALDAAALVVALYEASRSELDYALYDLGGAVAHLSIQAEALGLHVRQFATYDRAGLTREFHVEPPLTAVTILAVGRPPAGMEPVGRTRKDARELAWPPR